MDTFVWEVRLLNETQGFSKTFRPVARTAWAAQQLAYAELRDKGYDRDDFVVIAVLRGTNAS